VVGCGWMLQSSLKLWRTSRRTSDARKIVSPPKDGGSSMMSGLNIIGRCICGRGGVSRSGFLSRIGGWGVAILGGEWFTP